MAGSNKILDDLMDWLLKQYKVVYPDRAVSATSWDEVVKIQGGREALAEVIDKIKTAQRGE